jgi:hypothetical protein
VKHARNCPAFVVGEGTCTCAAAPERLPGGVLGHTPACPGRYTDPCTCGAGIPVVAPLPEMPSGPAQGATASPPPLPPTGDSPYADVEYARTLIKRAEIVRTSDMEQAAFLLKLAAEARLLAELQGRWEYES